MDYIQQQSNYNNFRAVHRCLDLLEAFIECTRPGVMTGQIWQNVNGDMNEFDDESSSDSIIVMGNSCGGSSGLISSINVPISLEAKDFRKTSPWDLGRYAFRYWQLPIGFNHFIKININNLQMHTGKDNKNFQIMINKYSRIGELMDVIAAILNQDKNLLQMTANNNNLQQEDQSKSLDAIGLGDGALISVMSIFAMNQDENYIRNIPDGASILSQNRFYIEILLELLNKKGNNDNLSGRLWNLLMRLPFNLSILQSLKEIATYVATDENGNNIITNQVNWNLFIDASSTFKLLYSLQIFDSVIQHCNSHWLDSFMHLNGLQHLYYTLIHFQFDYI